MMDNYERGPALAVLLLCLLISLLFLGFMYGIGAV